MTEQAGTGFDLSQNGKDRQSLDVPAYSVMVYPSYAQFRIIRFLSYLQKQGNSSAYHNAEDKPCLVWQPEDVRDES